MCGMFFTFDKDNIPLLSDYNSRRGGVNQSLLEIDIDKIAYVGHFQAPTSVVSRVHPNKLNSTMLWHNGILKDNAIKELQSKFNLHNEQWDTALLHEAILKNEEIGDIDGSFAVFLFKDNNFYFTRNALAPLYINSEKCIISSAKIKELNVDEIVKDGIWYIVKNSKIEPISNDFFKNFKTKNNPYNF